MSAAFEDFDDLDAEILRAVGSAWAAVDPVPAGLVDQVKYAMTVRMLEAEIAELTRMPELAARSEPAEDVRSISFSGSRVSLMVQVGEDSEGMLRLDGWATVGGALVELRVDGRVYEQIADHNGRLVWREVPSGSAHFVFWASADRSARPTVTPRFEL